MTSNIIFDTPDNPAPQNAITGYFDTHDGTKLRYAIFRSKATLAKGTIVLLQGRNETIEKYYETIGNLTDAGLWVATFDWRGQGGSQRLLLDSNAGYVEHFADYERDLEFFLENIVLPDARLPFYVIGHSTGGLIALSAAPRLANRVERMAVFSPFIGLSHAQFSQRTLRILTRLASQLGFGKYPAPGRQNSSADFTGNVLTSDAARFKRNRAIYETCPQFTLGGPSLRWISESLRTMKRVNDPAHLASIRIPTLIMGAGADSIVPIAAIEEMATRFRACDLITVDYARHEMFQEADLYRDQVMAALTTFIPGEA